MSKKNELPVIVEVEEEFTIKNEVDDFIEPQEQSEINGLSYPVWFIPLKDNLKCVVCLKECTGPEAAGPASGNALEENVRVIRLLKLVLEIDSKEIASFLEESNGKCPREWVGLCEKCGELVFQTFLIQDQIGKLQKKLQMCKESVKQTIQSTSTKRRRAGSGSITQKVRQLIYEGGTPHEDFATQSPSNLGDSGCGEEQESGCNEADGHSDSHELPLDSIPCKSSRKRKRSNLNEMGKERKAELVEDGGGHEGGKELPKKIRIRRKLDKQQPKEIEKLYLCESCPHLDKMDLDAFIVHLLFHWKQPNKCVECSMYLPSCETKIDKHWQTCHEELCSSSSSKYIRVEASPGKMWECGMTNCKELFATLAAREDHEVNAHQLLFETSQSCSVCKEGFRCENEVRLHKALNHPEVASLSCLYCDHYLAVESLSEGVYLRDNGQLHSHILEKHPNICREVGKRMCPQFLRDCPLCGKVITDGNCFLQFNEHLKREHKIRDKSTVMSCQICGEDLTPKILWWRHMYNFHMKDETCDMCGETMRPKLFPLHMLSKHKVLMKGHHMIKCEVEGCTFETLLNRNLKKHRERCHVEDRPRPWQCQNCGKSFFESAKLKEHEKIHKNEKSRPFQCEICGNSFAVKNYLYIHKRLTHLGKAFPSTNKKKTRSVRKPSPKSNIKL